MTKNWWITWLFQDHDWSWWGWHTTKPDLESGAPISNQPTIQLVAWWSTANHHALSETSRILIGQLLRWCWLLCSLTIEHHLDELNSLPQLFPCKKIAFSCAGCFTEGDDATPQLSQEKPDNYGQLTFHDQWKWKLRCENFPKHLSLPSLSAALSSWLPI